MFIPDQWFENQEERKYLFKVQCIPDHKLPNKTLAYPFRVQIGCHNVHVFPPHHKKKISYVEILIFKAMGYQKMRPLRGDQVMRAEPSLLGLVHFKKIPESSLTPLHHLRTVRSQQFTARKRALTRTQPCWHLILDFQLPDCEK